ncbi:hypothetical protein DBR42_23315 [Pelomonas sp. HMWF004]|nr:hypothetical protein DBR42_23315 [Pelomonas sp. HMWF004]
MPAMPMQAAIAFISKSFGVVVDVTGVDLGGARSQPVVGLHTAESAVAAAVSSGRYAVVDAGGQLRVVPLSQSLQRITVVGAKRDQAETGFKADYSATSARNGVSLQETPAGVTIITSKVIESQQATSVQDVMANVSSVVLTPGSQGEASLAIRGWGNAPVLSNGLASVADGSFNLSGIPSISTVQRIEVLKGPQAILAGAGVMGGAVNIVLKKPQEDPLYVVSLQHGRFNDTTFSADFSGAVLSDDKRLTYRLIGSKATADESLSGHNGRRETLFAPSLRWKDANTDVTLSLQSKRSRTAPNWWTYAVDGVIQEPPAVRTGNEEDGIESSSDRFTLDAERKLPFGLMLVSRLQYEKMQQRLHNYLPLVVMDPESQFVGFMGTNSDDRYDTVTGDHYLRGTVNTGPLEHKLALGFGHVQTLRRGTGYVAEGFLPVSLKDPAASFPALDETLQNRDEGKFKQHAYYVQDFVRWNNTSVLLGLRNTYVTSGDFTIEPEPAYGVKSVTSGNSTSFNSNSIGVVQSINDTLSLYAMVARGVKPQYGDWCSATPGAPDFGYRMMQTTNKEVGAKLDLLNGALAVTGGVFDLTQQNRPEFDPTQNCSTTRDGQRSRGLDIDVQGRIATGLNVIMNYTQVKLRDLSDPERKFDGQPERQASVWAQYALPWARVPGLGIGLGLAYHGKATAGSAFTPVPTEIPAWTRLDASLFYERAGWSGTVGLKNLGGKRIYGYSPNPSYIPITEDGRSVVLTLSYRIN